MLLQKMVSIPVTGVRITIGVLAIVLSAAGIANAQTTNVLTLKTFPGVGALRSYAPLVQANDGNYYGTTVSGGVADGGTVFRMTPAGVVTILHEFTGVGSDGLAPRGGLVQGNDGFLWGTTSLGGEGTGGTIFKMTLDGTLTTMYWFTGGNDGSTPYATLIQANDGNFYGTTVTDGGVGVFPAGYLGFGTIFRITPGGQHTTLHAFTGSAAGGGFFAIGKLVQAGDGNLYGTTNEGGSTNLGIVFKITLAGDFTVLHTFQGGADDGSHPWAGLVQGVDGALYGTTAQGGDTPFGWGLAYKITTDGSFSIVHKFSFFTELANLPLAGLVLANDGNFYGTTFYAGFAATGKVFRMTPGGTVTFIHTFATPGGTNPYAALIQGNDGDLYGTTFAGGSNGAGAVYKVSTGGAYTTLHSFFGSADGARPHAPLIRGTDGNLYGTTRIGGTANQGTVFKMTPGGLVTILHSFNDNADGLETPVFIEYSGLVQGLDGDFYGGFGKKLFKITSAGAVTILHQLDVATEGHTPSTLFQASDGNFYGTTRYGGGASNRGTLFRMTPAGTVTVLHEFTEGIVNDVSEFFLLGPYAPLVETGGILFGTTYFGGTTGDGFAFSLTLAGAFSVLHNFNASTTGSFSLAPLMVANDGQLYGMTKRGSTSSKGAVFRMTTGGSVTVVHAFTGGAADGAEPAGGLIQAPNLLFYGTTARGGSSNRGTIFSMTSGGVVTVMHTFTGANGVWPYAGLLRTPDGKFYSAVTFGGPTFLGMTPDAGPFLEQPTGMGAIVRMSFVTPFTDDPLVAGTVIKALHLNELRARIDVVRSGYSQGAFAYSEAVAAGVTIKAQHVIEMRTAITAAYVAASLTPPSFSALTVGTIIQALHITELRNAVKFLE